MFATNVDDGSRRRGGRHRCPGSTPAGRRPSPAGTAPRHGRRRTARGDALRALAGGLALVALAALTGGGPSAVPVPAAVASTVSSEENGPAGERAGKVCEKFGSTPVQGGRYEVQNSLWGSDKPQCVVAFDTGFSVEAKHSNDSGPASYPSIVFGCNYGNCTTGTPFPRPISDLGDLRSSWATTTPTSGDYNVAYDIWLDPTARKTGRPTGLELMIWLKHTDRVQPIGTKVGTATLAGVGYDVWLGKADLPTISYVRQQQTNEVKDLDITGFVTDAKNRGQAKDGWYLTSIQAGFEPWIGGDGLKTTSYSVTRNGQ